MKGLSPQSRLFGWPRKTFSDHQNPKTDSETDADHKRFYSLRYTGHIKLFSIIFICRKSITSDLCIKEIIIILEHTNINVSDL